MAKMMFGDSDKPRKKIQFVIEEDLWNHFLKTGRGLQSNPNDYLRYIIYQTVWENNLYAEKVNGSVRDGCQCTCCQVMRRNQITPS